MREIDAKFWISGLLAGLLLCCLPVAGVAESNASNEARNRVSFRVEVQRQAENDRLEAVLVASAEEADPAECARTVNSAMAWALEQARGNADVTVATTGYHTQPVYEDGKIRRWRAQQQLSLTSADTEAVVGIVSRLQARLALQSFVFSLSPERRRQIEDGLIEEALADFRARAELVRLSLDARTWRLDELSIDTDRGVIQPHRLERARVASMSAAPPVAVEAGTSQVSIHVMATVVLE